MKILVLGGAGKTGRHVVDQAIGAGHDVTVVIRDQNDIIRLDVRVFEGDAADPAVLDRAVAGQDAVLDVIGGKTPFLPTQLESSIAKAVIAAMRRHRVRRLLAVSMLGVGDSEANMTFYERLLLATFLRGADKDKSAMEAAVAASGLDWTVIRPALLTDGPATGRVRVFGSGSGDPAHEISRADVAAFMLAQISSDDHNQEAVTIASS